MAILGYARCSTQDQDLSAQIDALNAAGCIRIFREKVSGAGRDRPQLTALMKALREGDTVVITRLDRLARSTMNLLNLLDAIAKQGAAFKSLHETWCDTSTAHGRLFVTIIGGLGEFERELIKARTGEGRTRALAAGVKFGRKPKLTLYQRKEALARREAGETLQAIARSYGVDHSMISRLS